MKLIEPKAVWLGEATNSIELIEKAGRVCYRSEPKGDARAFVERLIARGHLSVLEHSNRSVLSPLSLQVALSHYFPHIKFFEFKEINEGGHLFTIITGNLRVWIEYYDAENVDLDWLCEIKYETPPEHKRYSAHIICDRGVLAEITRHRTLSFSVESSRYCDYSREMEFVRPCWDQAINTRIQDYVSFELFCNNAELAYKMARDSGWKPEQARYFMPMGAKTEMICTGNQMAWSNFFTLRLSKAAHPSIREIAEMLHKELPWR
jgi:flavin-dependent thymidylate synthase